MSSASTQPRAVPDDIAEAVATGDIHVALAGLNSLPPGEATPPVLRMVASLHMKRRQWLEASELLLKGGLHDPACRLQATLCLNLLGLIEHRPLVYARMLAAGGPGPYQVAIDERSQPVPLRVGPAGQRCLLSRHGDAEEALREALTRIEPLCQRQEPLCLAGIGDGRLVKALASTVVAGAMGMEQPVYVIEPDARLLWVVLMIHDYTGADGPIEQPRFLWFTGAAWADELTNAMLSELMLPVPAQIECATANTDEVVSTIRDILRRRSDRDQSWRKEIESYYAGFDRPTLSNLLGDDPPRTPRALLITTLFSTVIQHSIDDTADALEHLGFKTSALKEKAGHHRFSAVVLREALTRFRPDIVLVIDHLRSEYSDIFPEQLPFVCWIQDHLPALTNRRAGERIGPRDFILTSVAPMYTSQYEYPSRQCINLPKLTRVPRRPAAWKCDGDDLVYVSNGSATVEELVNGLLNGQTPESIPTSIVETACRQVVQMYENGCTLPTLWHLRRLVDRVSEEGGFAFPSDEIKHQLVLQLNHPLNNTLYRQQTLFWVRSWAEEHNASFALYGHGWEDHPHFAHLARGPIRYGLDLENLTRRSRINLQIVPSFCLHQRLLDGLVAGGFFLIRHTPADTVLPELAAFIERRLSPDACSIDASMSELGEADRPELAALLERAECLGELGGAIDVIEWTRCCLDSRVLDASGSALPRYEDVAFANEQALHERIDRFLSDDGLRTAISEQQRADVEQRLTYVAGMARVMARLRELIRDEVDIQR